MDFLYNAVLFVHLLCWAFMIGSWAATMKKPGLPKGFPHAAATALVTGVAMMGLKIMEDADINHMKLGIKLLVNLVIVVLAFMAQKKGDDASKPLINTIGGLTVINIVIALFISGAHGL